MKRKIWIIVTACVAALVIIAACLVGVALHRGLGWSEAYYIETDHGHMLLIDNSPVSMSGRDGLFDDLTTGDQVLVVHGPIAESYPGQSTAYLCIKQSDGTKGEIPADIIDSLQELGWLSYACQ